MNNNYKVSVITAVLNGADTLSRTINSVAQQDYPAMEYIVVDGGSTDGTLELIESACDIVDCCIEGPDSGIAEAMNKGLSQATGDLVLFLHADDCFADNKALTRAMMQVDNLDTIWAFDILFGDDQRQIRRSPRPFSVWTRFKNPLPHQGVLCPRRVFDKLGAFDPSLRIDMDYDFWLRAYLADVPLRQVPEVLAVMGSGGVSSRRDWTGLSARFREERRVQLKHAAGMAWRLLYAAYWPLYLAYRRLRIAFAHCS